MMIEEDQLLTQTTVGREGLLAPLLQWKVLPGTPFSSTAEVPELRIESI